MIREKVFPEIFRHPFWATPVAEVVSTLGTDVQSGLSEEEVERRAKTYGPNSIEKPRRAPGLRIFVNQLKSPLILILLVAGGITLFIGQYRDALFILAAVVANAALGFYQEYKAEKALAELETYLKQRARVVRGGVEREIDAAGVVPGDLMRLAQGDRIAADGRLVFVNDLQVDEALLTGESLPVVKSTEPVGPAAPVADQTSMVFAGTLVTQGMGTAVVCRTDLSTELGKIATLVAEARREETPLQASIRIFSLHMGAGLLLLTAGIFGAGLLLGYPLAEMFLTSVAIAVSAVPEGLPVAMTVILAVGVERMAKRKGVIRRLVAAETLGSATVILTDKTGTLTTAKMELSAVLPSAPGKEQRLLELALLNTNVLIENLSDAASDWRLRGKILETALVRSAALRGTSVEEVKRRIPTLGSLPFHAGNKFSASLIREAEKDLLLLFGAPDILVGHSTLGVAEKAEMLERISTLASSGELVVGVATKEVTDAERFVFARDLDLTKLLFQGLLTLRDPVRESVKGAIRAVEQSGIRVVIMTGDHRGTAEAVAREVGIPLKEGAVLDAVELATLSDADLSARLPLVRVVARVSPEDKLRIVEALQGMGEVVAMTGDGVNDAPSITRADIGIAMGSGTEVAREVADLVILDDNFETIAAAVEEGRQIRGNLRKVLVYLFSTATDALFLIGGALMFGLALPLNALQILWVNFFSDSFPAVAFAFETTPGPARPPRRGQTGLFDPLMKFLVLGIGLSTSALLFVLYWFLLRAGFSLELVQTFVFASFGTYTLFLAFSLRSLEASILNYHMFSNRYLVAGTGVGVVLMVAAIYLPLLQGVLGTVPLPPAWLVGVVAVGMVNILAVEFGKWLFRRRI